MNVKFLEGQVALITGASKGIGLSIAQAFAEAGAKVIISSRDQGVLDEVSSAMRKKGLEVWGSLAMLQKWTHWNCWYNKRLKNMDK